jgi:ribosome modulation factor
MWDHRESKEFEMPAALTKVTVKSQGYAAQKAGTPKSACPYKGLRAHVWKRGWMKAYKKG